MKKIKIPNLMFAIGVIIFIYIAIGTQSSPDSEQEKYSIDGTAKYSFELRSEPSLYSDATESIKKDEKFQISVRYLEWVKVKTSTKKTGWAAIKWINIDKYTIDKIQKIVRKDHWVLSDESVSVNMGTNPSSSDSEQAKDFLRTFPPECSNSHISVAFDGTVIINVRCENADDSLNGQIRIKNGRVTKIR